MNLGNMDLAKVMQDDRERDLAAAGRVRDLRDSVVGWAYRSATRRAISAICGRISTGSSSSASATKRNQPSRHLVWPIHAQTQRLPAIRITFGRRKPLGLAHGR